MTEYWLMQEIGKYYRGMDKIKYSFHNNRRIDRLLNKMHLTFILKIKDKYKTSQNIKKNRKKAYRMLEIGPGLNRITDFETLNIIDGRDVDYIHDLTKKLPFEDNSFDIIYASHVLEHVPWHLQKEIFNELHRILKTGGTLEIWVPDGWKIIKNVYDYEVNNIDNIHLDGWYRFNEEKDVIIWANGRIFTYGDGSGNIYHPNWHKTIYTPKFLYSLFDKTGFKHIEQMSNEEVRGYDHGWINLGIKGTK